MAISVKDLKDWLKGLEKGDYVFVDEDGMTLCSLGRRSNCIEVSGDPCKPEPKKKKAKAKK